MNKKSFLSLFLVSSLFLTSCKKELEPQDSIPTTPTAVDSSKVAEAPVQVQPNNLVPATATAAVASGMNPAHGQPGHRCDIAVGVPLNSPATKTTAQQTTTQQIQSPANTATAVPTKTAPGMNPPHGQPGHRCDIAVGAPLSSPVSKPISQSSTAQVQQTQQTGNTPLKITQAVANPDGTPAVAPSNSNTGTPAILNPTTTAPGMNPPHGQPGHVCSTPVGSPLPK